MIICVRFTLVSYIWCFRVTTVITPAAVVCLHVCAVVIIRDTCYVCALVCVVVVVVAVAAVVEEEGEALLCIMTEYRI